MRSFKAILTGLLVAAVFAALDGWTDWRWGTPFALAFAPLAAVLYLMAEVVRVRFGRLVFLLALALALLLFGLVIMIVGLIAHYLGG